MAKISLISPPDKLHNNNLAINVINATQEEKENLSHYLTKQELEKDLNIFVYSNESNPTWLLDVVNGKNSTYINLDNTVDISVNYTSYMLSLSNVYYSSTNKNTLEAYSLINQNAVEDVLDFMEKVFNG